MISVEHEEEEREVIHVLLPISMVGGTVARAFVELFSDRGDPDGSESHPLDVIELTALVSAGTVPKNSIHSYMVDDALPATTAVCLHTSVHATKSKIE